jgi:3'-5' exoribonuclease
MSPKSMPVVPLFELKPDQEADFFAMMTTKEELKTKTGNPYFKVAFRDANREVSFPIWDNSPWAADCRDGWNPGSFYKIRATFRETNFGPQLDIRKIREVNDDDNSDGFDPSMCRPQSQFDPQQMLEELTAIITEQVTDEHLRQLVESIIETNRDALLVMPAAKHNHHAYAAGLLEHTLSVTRLCVQLAEKYSDYYPDMRPPLHKGLVIAGAVLHDIGKVRELRMDPEGTTYTSGGSLVGHILMGRDMVREAADGIDIDAETLLRLEHLILAHQRLPEWGSPKPPMTPEALIVHYADDLDAKYHMMYAILRDDAAAGPLTTRRNVLGQQVYRGES